MESLLPNIQELQFVLNTFYLLISGAFVMWMAAGFAMLEAGLVRAKNTTEILTKNILLYAASCTVFLLFGYGVMYVNNVESGFIPNFNFGLGDEDTDATSTLHANFFFQTVFVATAMSIVSGAVAERMRLWVFLAFSLFMTGFIYPISGYWVWGSGFLSEVGFVDFAGSGVVHLAGATAALSGVFFLGPRIGKYKEDGSIIAIQGANMPLATLGTFILWLGWFGFNGGSQLALASKDDVQAISTIFVNTNTAAATGALGALLMTKWTWGKVDLTMVLNGALAGLVTITAQPATPSIYLTCLLGALAGILVVCSIVVFDKLRIDDPVGALSVHGVCGVFGLLVVPISDPSATYQAQLIGTGAIFAWVLCASSLIWWVLKQSFGLRISEEQERVGMDVYDCGVSAYPEFIPGKKP